MHSRDFISIQRRKDDKAGAGKGARQRDIPGTFQPGMGTGNGKPEKVRHRPWEDRDFRSAEKLHEKEYRPEGREIGDAQGNEILGQKIEHNENPVCKERIPDMGLTGLEPART